jgi:predicted ATP-dependent protease
VFDQGDHQFGRPVRITAGAAVGKAGIVNIERKAGLSGALYDKGVLILTGFLMERYGRNLQLNLRASVTLEQSYGGIDGDSASSTELYALLSALSGAPVDQSIAVTGSVNQKGEVQPVGGTAFKIEGFYDVCASRGLTGSQGVMIPAKNIESVILRPEVEKAAEQGRFHIWAVSTVDEGIELLTGIPAGRERPDGTFPEGTINAMVMKRLSGMSALAGKGREDE